MTDADPGVQWMLDLDAERTRRRFERCRPWSPPPMRHTGAASARVIRGATIADILRQLDEQDAGMDGWPEAAA